MKQLIKRLKALAWSAGCMGAITALTYLGAELLKLELTHDWQKALVVVACEATAYVSLIRLSKFL